MGLFGEVKCGRCDRRYSAIRSRCPYCGARKRRGGKSSGNGDNRWQVVFGVALLVVIIVAVAVLVYKNINAGKPKPAASPAVQTTSTAKPALTPTPPPTATPLPAVTPAAAVKVTAITLSRQDFTLVNIGETWVLSATVSPSTASQNINWSSQNAKVATVSTSGRVTAVAAGTTTITAESGGVTATCIVRVIGSGTVPSPSPSASAGTGSPGNTGSTSVIGLNYTDVTMNATTQETLKLSVSGTTAAPVFSGGSSSIATIDSSGTVKAIAPGTVSVYATVGDTKLECIIRVVKR